MNDIFYSKIQDPIQAIQVLGEIFALSGMFGCKKVEQGCVLAMACLIEQRNPMDYLKTYHLNDGKLTKRADAMLAEFMELGGKCEWISKINDCKEARAKWTFGANVDLETTYTLADAEREGSAGKDTYKKSTPDMLRARLISKTIRMIAPKVVAGCYTPEEFGGELLPALTDSKAPEKGKVISIQHEVKNKVDVPIQTVPVKKSAEDEKDEAAMGLAPTQPKPVEPAAAPVAPTATSESPTEKPDNFPEVEALLKGANATEKANAWLLKNKWIKEGQTYEALNKNQCANILRRPQNFIKAING
jgi:hypothetical protein